MQATASSSIRSHLLLRISPNRSETADCVLWTGNGDSRCLGTYGLAAIQAAKIRQMVMRPEKIIGTMKKYFQLKNVTTMKHAARAHVTTGIANKDSLGRPPSCHDSAARKNQKDCDEKPEASVEVPISPV